MFKHLDYLLQRNSTLFFLSVVSKIESMQGQIGGLKNRTMDIEAVLDDLSDRLADLGQNTQSTQAFKALNELRRLRAQNVEAIQVDMNNSYQLFSIFSGFKTKKKVYLEHVLNNYCNFSIKLCSAV